MNNDRDPRSGQVPLPRAARPDPADGWVPLPDLGRGTPEARARQTRDEGLRHVRRMSNWTAAALVVGTGAAAIALAHNAVPITPPTFPGSTVSGTTPTGTVVTNGAHGPQVGHTVATTSASGVTTTTTQLPNGKTVVTHSGQASGYHDD